MELRDKIEEETGQDTRVSILGHTQRGGAPTAVDRLLASCMAKYAVDMICEGQRNLLICGDGTKISAVPLEDVVQNVRKPNLEMYQIARMLSI